MKKRILWILVLFVLVGCSTKEENEKNPLVFPNITYGFYPVFAELNRIPYKEIPLKDDFTIDVNDYIGVNSTVVIANPNAPTGICLSPDEIEQIVKSNADNVNCGAFIQELSVNCKGNGGGSKTFAQGGGSDATDIVNSLEKIKEEIKSLK